MGTLFALSPGDGVEAALAEGVAAEDAPEGQCGADEDPPFADRLDAVLGAGGGKAARRLPLERGDKPLIQAHRYEKDENDGLVDFVKNVQNTHITQLCFRRADQTELAETIGEIALHDVHFAFRGARIRGDHDEPAGAHGPLPLDLPVRLPDHTLRPVPLDRAADLFGRGNADAVHDFVLRMGFREELRPFVAQNIHGNGGGGLPRPIPPHLLIQVMFVYRYKFHIQENAASRERTPSSRSRTSYFSQAAQIPSDPPTEILFPQKSCFVQHRIFTKPHTATEKPTPNQT